MALLSELLEEKYFREVKETFREGLVSMLPSLRRLIVKLYEGAQFQVSNLLAKHWELPVEAKLIACLRVACKVSRPY